MSKNFSSFENLNTLFTSIGTKLGNKYDVNDGVETDLQDDDFVPFYDTSKHGKRKSRWSNIKAKLKAYFDTIYSTFSGSYNDLTDKPTIYKKGVYYGTCTGQAANQTKAVTIAAAQGFTLEAGATIYVKFDANNTYSATAAAPVKLNVNNTGAKNVYYAGSSAPTGTNTTAFGRTNYINQYIYDGTYWVWTGSSADNNTTYSAMSASELTTGTATTSRTVRADYLKSGINSLIDAKTAPLQDQIGDLSDLETHDKDSLVDAINEVAQGGGGGGSWGSITGDIDDQTDLQGELAKKVITLTKAQYDALSTEEKEDLSKVYYVTDYGPLVVAELNDTVSEVGKVWSSLKISTELGKNVAKSGDVMTGTIRRDIPGGSSTTYIEGCGGKSGLHINKAEGDIYYTAFSIRTKTGGGWAVGNYNNDNLQFSFGTKANIESNTNDVKIVNLRPTPGTIALTSEIPSAYAGSDSAGGKANSAAIADVATHVKYQAGNEINFKGGAQTTCWFNYRNADTGEASAVSAMTYKFANYSNDTSKTTLDAKSFTGNAATASAVKDSYNSTNTTFAYGKEGLAYGNYTWLAGWNGYELRAVAKSQFSPASSVSTRTKTASITVNANSWGVVTITESSLTGNTVFMSIFADVNNASIVPINIVGRGTGTSKQFYVRNIAGSSQTATITVITIYFRN